MSAPDDSVPARPVSARAASAQFGVAPQRRTGVSKLWVVAALLIGLVVGVAGSFAVSLFMSTPEKAPAAEVPESRLDLNLWFADGDKLPKSATEPGSTLKLGDTANVLVGASNGTQSVAALTVESVDALNEQDSKTLQSAQPALAGQSLFRINYTVQYVSGDPLAGLRLGEAVYPVDAEGKQLLRVPVSGWKKCGEAALPAKVDAVTEGAEIPAAVKMCAVAASPAGAAPVVGALFAQAGGPYSLESSGQLTWLPVTNATKPTTETN